MVPGAWVGGDGEEAPYEEQSDKCIEGQPLVELSLATLETSIGTK